MRFHEKQLKLTLNIGLVLKTQQFPTPQTYWTFIQNTQAIQNSCYLILEIPGKKCRLYFMPRLFISKKSSLLIFYFIPQNLIISIKSCSKQLLWAQMRGYKHDITEKIEKTRSFYHLISFFVILLKFHNRKLTNIQQQV